MKILIILKCIILQAITSIAFSSHTVFEGFSNQGSIAHIAPRGLGYTNGYTTASLFLTPKIYPKGYCFIEGRAHVFDDGKFASNLGFGTRWKPKHSLASYGVNIFYDNRQQHHFFHQIGAGFEFQKDRVVFNTNLYLTAGSKRTIFQKTSFDYEHGYCIDNVSAYQALSNRFDSEIGFFILTDPKHKFYIGVGPYRFNSRTITSNNFKTWGGKAHLHLNLNQLFHIEMFISHDTLFRTNIQAQLSLTIPLSKIKQFAIPFTKVIRQEIIPLQEWDYWRWNY